MAKGSLGRVCLTLYSISKLPLVDVIRIIKCLGFPKRVIKKKKKSGVAPVAIVEFLEVKRRLNQILKNGAT